MNKGFINVKQKCLATPNVILLWVKQIVAIQNQRVITYDVGGTSLCDCAFF
jgi:hypothetical protein